MSYLDAMDIARLSDPFQHGNWTLDEDDIMVRRRWIGVGKKGGRREGKEWENQEREDDENDDEEEKEKEANGDNDNDGESRYLSIHNSVLFCWTAIHAFLLISRHFENHCQKPKEFLI